MFSALLLLYFLALDLIALAEGMLTRCVQILFFVQRVGVFPRFCNRLASQTYLLCIYYVGRRARKGEIRRVYLADFP